MKSPLLLIALFFTLAVKSQTTTTKDSVTIVKQLSEVIVTSKIPQKNIDIAKSIEIISLEKQTSKGSNSMYGLLNTVSGVYMVDMGNEQHAMSIRLPINYSPLYNYLEDGIPLRPVGIFNNNELLEINRYAAQKIEIIKGPFSSGYGAHSIGAAVNFIPKKYDNASTQISLQSNGFGQWETVLQIKQKIGSWKLFANINHTQRKVNNDYHFDYTKQGFSFSLEKDINAKNNIAIKHSTIGYRGDQRDGYDSATFYAKNYTSFDKFSDRKTTAIRNSVVWKHKVNEWRNLNVTLFNRILMEKQNPFYLISYDYANPMTTVATGQITSDKFLSIGLNIEHNITSKNSKLKYNQNLYIDLTPNNNYRSSFINVTRANGVNVSFTNPDSLLTRYSANLKNIALSNTVQYLATDKIILFASLRADLLGYNFKNFLASNAYSGSPSGKNAYFSVNPEVSFLYKLTKTQSAFVQFSKGFTPPILSNLYRGVKTPTLKPAKYFNTELGYKFFKNNTNIQVSLYNMNGSDEFVSVIRNTGVEVVNAGKTNHHGVEIQLQHSFKNFEMAFSPSMHKHTFKSYSNFGVTLDGNTINGAPSYLHNMNFSYIFRGLKNMRVTAEWNKVGPYYINQSNTKKYGGYDLFNIKSTIAVNKIFINVGLNNLLNTIYATNADGTYGIRYYPGIKRTLQAGVSYTF
jgi:iron complex outermembrane recepter protein